MASGDTDAVMRAVASIEVMVPQTGGSEDLPGGSLSLPVIEQDGTSYVPVFTSEATMNQAAPDIDGAVSVPVAALSANWPSDELWLAVNPGTEGGLTFPPDAVKSLPGYAKPPARRSVAAPRLRGGRPIPSRGPSRSSGIWTAQVPTQVAAGVGVTGGVSHGETGVPGSGTRVSG